MKVELSVRVTAGGAEESRIPHRRTYPRAYSIHNGMSQDSMAADSVRSSAPKPRPEEISRWSASRAKRFFDFMCVLAILPVVFPIFLLSALAVWLTSEGPVFFRQQCAGKHGRRFILLKFRTRIRHAAPVHPALVKHGIQPFTIIGSLLHCSKLDRLPQMINVLRGDMSLVGPFPQTRDHAAELPCRPGVTGAAAVAFAGEETLLDCVPEEELENYFYRIMLPAKRRLDAEYMTRATFLSDLRLVFDTVLCRRNDSQAARLLAIESLRSSGKFHEMTAANSAALWNGAVPIRVASVSARIGARRSA